MEKYSSQREQHEQRQRDVKQPGMLEELQIIPYGSWRGLSVGNGRI